MLFGGGCAAAAEDSLLPKCRSDTRRHSRDPRTTSSNGSDAAKVLKRRLVELDAEIDALRGHQRAMLQLLGHKAFRKAKMITKDKWVSIMRSCGFSNEQMHRWHAEFERSAPDEHQEFLEFLHIPAEEINTIRKQSRVKA